jgi:hypothetical protein
MTLINELNMMMAEIIRIHSNIRRIFDGTDILGSSIDNVRALEDDKKYNYIDF